MIKILYYLRSYMKRIFNCLTCFKEKTVTGWEKQIITRRYCSRKCTPKSITNPHFWSVASKEEKLSRLKTFFDKYVIRESFGCWKWNGPLLDGRGKLMYEGKAIQAHRASWLLHRGEIPKNMYVCHTCDNKICTNPDHLFLGTPSDNTIDMVKKGRFHRAKLNCEKVKEIKKMLANDIKSSEIAKLFKVKPMLISDIKLNKTWRHV